MPGSSADQAFLDTLERRTFQWFWDLSDAHTGLTPDRWPTRSFVSVGAVGFALTAYPIGAERGWVTRARRRGAYAGHAALLLERAAGHDARGVHAATADSSTTSSVPETGARFERRSSCPPSTPRLMLAGAAVLPVVLRPARAGRGSASGTVAEVALRARRLGLGAAAAARRFGLGWTPEDGCIPEWDWRGYNEAMMLQILALGSPTHRGRRRRSWQAWTSTYRWGTFHGHEHRGLRAAVRPPVLARVDRLPRHPGPSTCARTGSRLLRELAARRPLAQRAYAIDKPATASRGYGDAAVGTDAPATDRWTARSTIDGTAARSSIPTPRAAPRSRASRTTAP